MQSMGLGIIFLTALQQALALFKILRLPFNYLADVTLALMEYVSFRLIKKKGHYQPCLHYEDSAKTIPSFWMMLKDSSNILENPMRRVIPLGF